LCWHTNEPDKNAHEHRAYRKDRLTTVARVLTPKWTDGDIFVVERTFAKHDAISGRQGTSICKYNLDLEKNSDGYRIRETGLLPGPLPERSSEAFFNHLDKLVQRSVPAVFESHCFVFGAADFIGMNHRGGVASALAVVLEFNHRRERELFIGVFQGRGQNHGISSSGSVHARQTNSCGTSTVRVKLRSNFELG